MKSRFALLACLLFMGGQGVALSSVKIYTDDTYRHIVSDKQNGQQSPNSSDAFHYQVTLSPTFAHTATPTAGRPFGVAINGTLLNENTAKSWQVHADHGPKLVGWAMDGFPIYALLGYEDPNQNSPVIKLKSSYMLKKGVLNLMTGKTTEVQYQYVKGAGDLDQCNGRLGVTPEFPNGTYYYVLTDKYPYVPKCLRGIPNQSFVAGAPIQTQGANKTLAGYHPAVGKRQRPLFDKYKFFGYAAVY